MVKTLGEHFNFWDTKIAEINRTAILALEELDAKHSLSEKKYRDFLNSVTSVVPNTDRELTHVENVERILLNLYKIKDARYIRAKSLLRQEKIQAELLIKRFSEMRRQLHNMRKKLKKERNVLLVMITDSIKKAINKRRAEFKKLWVKYTKVTRSIENLQHKENCRLRYLESKLK